MACGGKEHAVTPDVLQRKPPGARETPRRRPAPPRPAVRSRSSDPPAAPLAAAVRAGSRCRPFRRPSLCRGEVVQPRILTSFGSPARRSVKAATWSSRPRGAPRQPVDRRGMSRESEACGRHAGPGPATLPRRVPLPLKTRRSTHRYECLRARWPLTGSIDSDVFEERTSSRLWIPPLLLVTCLILNP